MKAARGEPATELEGQVWDTADDESESESDPGPEAEVPEKRAHHPVCCICRASSKDRDAFCCWSDGVLCPRACCTVCVVAVGAPACQDGGRWFQMLRDKPFGQWCEACGLAAESWPSLNPDRVRDSYHQDRKFREPLACIAGRVCVWVG